MQVYYRTQRKHAYITNNKIIALSFKKNVTAFLNDIKG